MTDVAHALGKFVISTDTNYLLRKNPQLTVENGRETKQLLGKGEPVLDLCYFKSLDAVSNSQFDKNLLVVFILVALIGPVHIR